MTVALFALLEPEVPGAGAEDWLAQLVAALSKEAAINKLVLFTYESCWTASRLNQLEVIVLERPKFFWSRFRLQQSLRSQVAGIGADRVICYGLSAYVPGFSNALILLTAGDFQEKRVLQLKKKAFAEVPVFVANERARENILRLTNNRQQVNVVYGSLPECSVVELDTQLVKDRFTDGAEYFLCQANLAQTAEIINLLKAFSRFKRRQKSGWKLVLVPETGGVPKDLEELLATYKYREDVVLVPTPSAEVVQSLYAAAWCFVYPGTPGYWAKPLVHALAWQLPLIGTDACRERVGAAGLYFEAGDEVALADHLMHIYKDEDLHRRLRDATLQEQAKFGWQPLLSKMGL